MAKDIAAECCCLRERLAWSKVPKSRINIFKLCVLKDRIFPPIKTCRGYLEPGAPCAYILHDSLKKIFSYTTAAPLFLKWFFLPMPPTEFMNFQVAQRFSSGILSTTIELTLLNSHFYALLWEHTQHWSQMIQGRKFFHRNGWREWFATYWCAQ